MRIPPRLAPDSSATGSPQRTPPPGPPVVPFARSPSSGQAPVVDRRLPAGRSYYASPTPPNVGPRSPGVPHPGAAQYSVPLSLPDSGPRPPRPTNRLLLVPLFVDRIRPPRPTMTNRACSFRPPPIPAPRKARRTRNSTASADLLSTKTVFLVFPTLRSFVFGFLLTATECAGGQVTVCAVFPPPRPVPFACLATTRASAGGL